MNGSFLDRRKLFMSMMAGKWAILRADVATQLAVDVEGVAAMIAHEAEASPSLLLSMIAGAIQRGTSSISVTLAATFTPAVCAEEIAVALIPVTLSLTSSMTASSEVAAIVSVDATNAQIAFSGVSTPKVCSAQDLNVTFQIAMLALQVTVYALPLKACESNVQCTFGINADVAEETHNADLSAVQEMSLGITLDTSSLVAPAASATLDNVIVITQSSEVSGDSVAAETIENSMQISPVSQASGGNDADYSGALALSISAVVQGAKTAILEDYGAKTLSQITGSLGERQEIYL